MENVFDISLYINELAVVAVICGIIHILGDKMQGGLSKFISLACSLVMSFYLISPLAEFLGGDNTPSIDGNFSTSAFEQGSIEDFYSILTQTTLDNLIITAQAEIEHEFNIGKNEYRISFEGGIQNERFELKLCNITFKTFSALSLRDDVVEYIEERFGCGCDVYEDII